uniref:Uncharacterized protein n=1 Tax=Glossina austeni TaxID=7395 RepID=A0A1A9UQ36_GLOAU
MGDNSQIPYTELKHLISVGDTNSIHHGEMSTQQQLTSIFTFHTSSFDYIVRHLDENIPIAFDGLPSAARHRTDRCFEGPFQVQQSRRPPMPACDCNLKKEKRKKKQQQQQEQEHRKTKIALRVEEEEEEEEEETEKNLTLFAATSSPCPLTMNVISGSVMYYT